jgi:hypothetical protein
MPNRLLKFSISYTYNCCRVDENELKSGREPLSLFCDKSNTCRSDETLEIDGWNIRFPKPFPLKFLEHTI